MIAFIDDHREAYGVEPICKVLPIAPSTYRAHATRRSDPAKLPLRAQRDLALTAEIQRVSDTNFGVYGVRKVWRQLTDDRGAWHDNVFVERLWRSVKYEDVYLRAYDSVGESHVPLATPACISNLFGLLAPIYGVG
jgi:hypothetical protein